MARLMTWGLRMIYLNSSGATSCTISRIRTRKTRQPQIRSVTMAFNRGESLRSRKKWRLSALLRMLPWTCPHLLPSLWTSPGHFKNIKGDYTHSAIAVVELNGKVYFTQLFAKVPNWATISLSDSIRKTDKEPTESPQSQVLRKHPKQQLLHIEGQWETRKDLNIILNLLSRKHKSNFKLVTIVV